MPDKFSMLLWEFDENGVCCGYYLADKVHEEITFTECDPWEHVDGSVWRTDKDGDVYGYYKKEDIPSIAGKASISIAGTNAKSTRCRERYDGAHKCEKRRWRRKGCCCMGWDRDEIKIPRSCTK